MTFGHESWSMNNEMGKTYFAGTIHLPNFEHFHTLIFTFFAVIAIIQTSGNNNTIRISAIIPLDIFFHVLQIKVTNCTSHTAITSFKIWQWNL